VFHQRKIFQADEEFLARESVTASSGYPLETTGPHTTETSPGVAKRAAIFRVDVDLQPGADAAGVPPVTTGGVLSISTGALHEFRVGAAR